MLTSKNGENGIRIAFSCPQDSPGARPHDVSKTPPDDPTTPQDDPESILPAPGGASFERMSADTAEERFKRAGAVKMAFLKISGNAEERFKRAGAVKMALVAAALGRLGGVLGPSWGVLGASWGRLGGVLVGLGGRLGNLGPLIDQSTNHLLDIPPIHQSTHQPIDRSTNHLIDIPPIDQSINQPIDQSTNHLIDIPRAVEYPGPAACAKRLNNINQSTNQLII